MQHPRDQATNIVKSHPSILEVLPHPSIILNPSILDNSARRKTLLIILKLHSVISILNRKVVSLLSKQKG